MLWARRLVSHPSLDPAPKLTGSLDCTWGARQQALPRPLGRGRLRAGCSPRAPYAAGLFMPRPDPLDPHWARHAPGVVPCSARNARMNAFASG